MANLTYTMFLFIENINMVVNDKFIVPENDIFKEEYKAT